MRCIAWSAETSSTASSTSRRKLNRPSAPTIGAAATATGATASLLVAMNPRASNVPVSVVKKMDARVDASFVVDERRLLSAKYSVPSAASKASRRSIRSTLHLTHCWVSDAVLVDLPPVAHQTA